MCKSTKILALERIIYTNIIDGIAKIIIDKPSVTGRKVRLVSFKPYIKTEYEKPKVISQLSSC